MVSFSRDYRSLLLQDVPERGDWSSRKTAAPFVRRELGSGRLVTVLRPEDAP